MNVDALIDTLLRKAGAAADEAEVFHESSFGRPVLFEDNRLKYVAETSERGVGLRVIHNGRLGFSSTSDLGRLDELVASAVESAKFGQEAAFALPERCEPAQVRVYDEAAAQATAAEMADLVREAIDGVLAKHPEVQCSASASACVEEERIANTRGLDVGHRCTSFSAHLSALAVQDEGLLWVGDGRTDCRRLTDLAPLVAKTTRDLDLAGRNATIATGAVPAVFTPDAMASLLVSLSEGVNGKHVQKGASPLVGRLGERVVDERITVLDDALIDYAASSAPHDTEGLASRRTPVIENGVLRCFLFDLQTAGLVGAEPTGNGLRDHVSQPNPGDNNTVVCPGDTSFEDMLRGMGRGLLVDSVLGAAGHSLAGDFSVNLELGFLVENGEVVGRLKNCMLFGNVYDLLRDEVEAIGDTPEMKGSLSLPPFCFKRVSVGTH